MHDRWADLVMGITKSTTPVLIADPGIPKSREVQGEASRLK
jgi:hypothetical protein